MAFANLKSKRLQDVLSVLKGGGSYDIKDLVFKSGQPNAGTIVSELKQNGVRIKKERVGKYWVYSLLPF